MRFSSTAAFLTRQPDHRAHRGGLADHVVAGHLGPPAVGRQQGGEDAHGGGLARPVGAEKAQHRARGHLEVDAVEGADLAEVLDQPLGQHGRTVAHPLPPTAY